MCTLSLYNFLLKYIFQHMIALVHQSYFLTNIGLYRTIQSYDLSNCVIADDLE